MTSSMYVRYMQNPKGKWTWVVYSNGKIFAGSLRYYTRLSDCKRAFEKLDRLF